MVYSSIIAYYTLDLIMKYVPRHAIQHDVMSLH